MVVCQEICSEFGEIELFAEEIGRVAVRQEEE